MGLARRGDLYALVPERKALAPGRNPAAVYLGRLAPSGRRTMRASLDRMARMLGPCTWSDCPWHLVRYEHASALRAVLLQTLAPNTVNRHLTALRGVVREAWRLGFIDAETMHQVVDVQNVKHRTLPAGRMLSREEVRALDQAADDRDRQVLALLCYAGLRRSEAASICCEDVTWEEGTVRVRVREGKGGAERIVSVGGLPGKRILKASWEGEEGSLLRLSPTGIYERLRRLAERAGIPHASPHDLRRSFVSHALDAGVDLATVAGMAGHVDPRTTARYDRRGERAMDEAARRLDEHLG